jgi:mRNA interferase MazF
MTSYSFGDILLLRFPYSDMGGIAKRPAFVLYDSGDMDILVCRVTTQRHSTTADFDLNDWKSAGLLRRSHVRIAKMATLEKQVVERKLGKVSALDIAKAQKIVRRMFGLNEYH